MILVGIAIGVFYMLSVILAFAVGYGWNRPND